MIKGVDIQRRRRQMSQGAGWGQLESKGKKGEHFVLKNGSFCAVIQVKMNM